MDTKDIIKATQSTQRLIQDANYYKYIFKKTERIVSVVFYITQAVEQTDKNTSQIEDLEMVARSLHDVVLASLHARAHVAEDVVQQTTHELVRLESKLRVAQVMGLIASEVLGVVCNEIDSVLRGLSKYSNEDSLLSREFEPAPRVGKPAGVSSSHQPAVSNPSRQTSSNDDAGMSSRRARILTVIEAKEEVSIKDITDIISDVSEKTIQRELNAMIEDNQIKRVGERRWSKYVFY